MTRFVVDAEWVRGEATSGNARGVLAGSPPAWFSVTTAGEAILDALETGAPLPAGHEPLTSRLSARGAIHPVVDVDTDSLAEASDITVVIPARVDADGAAHLARLVAHLAPLHVIVVDDHSTPPLTLDGARIISHVGVAGPGPARNTGLAHVTTPIVAFVDADAWIDARGVQVLATLVATGNAVLVAPRVSSTASGPNGEYETTRSPLDLGGVRAMVRPFSRVSYLPSAVLVAATGSVRDVGGFDPALRWGEDVDLVWRAVADGFTCRYEPTVVAEHRARPTLAGFVAQRFRYGSSAGPLGARHGAVTTPLRTNLAVAASSSAWLCTWWQVAVPVSLAVWMWFTAGLARTGLSRTNRARIAARALWRSLDQTAAAVRRAWWPLVIACAPFTWRATAVLALSFGVPVVVGVARRRPRRIIGWIARRLLDDLAYSVGVWRGVVATRSVRCVMPVVSVRPTSVR